MNKLISTADLNEQLLDTLNGMNALISELARRAQLSDKDVQQIRFKASAGHKRVLAKMAEADANRLALKEDQEAMAAWALDSRFMFPNAKEWAAAAETEWLVITERNGSQHGRPHGLRYREPTQAELLKALDIYGKWANADEQKYAAHRARANRVLPSIKKKLAALLSA